MPKVMKWNPPADPRNHSRNVCIFADGELDRSPTGTGVSTRATLLYAKRELGPDESFTVESILEMPISSVVMS